MNELHLHQLWKSKRLPFHLLSTTNQKSISIIEVGEYNTGSGPDFFNGQIEIDGLRMAGNIEMHLKSSDWYAHGHQNDRAYDNVILHVVYQHDKPVFINEKEILTLELGHLVYWLGNELPSFSTSKIACGNGIAVSTNLSKQLDAVLIQRLDRKTERFFSDKYQIQTFFELFVESFGRKVNAIPFLTLAQNIRIEMLLRCSTLQKKAIVLGMSGLNDFDQIEENWEAEWLFLKSCHHLYELEPHIWKTKGNRPASFPKNRVAQLAALIPQVDWLYPFWEDSEEEIISFWKSMLTMKDETIKFSDEFTNHILINAVVPYVYFQGKYRNNPAISAKALELLKSLKPEKNAIINEYKNSGVKVQNSYQTQALLEQHKNWCMEKKCLTCEVGKEILPKERQSFFETHSHNRES